MSNAIGKRTDGLWSTAEAAQIVGASFRNVQFWARKIVEPRVPAKGIGSDRRYAWDDLIILKVITDLSDSMSVPLRRSLARELKQTLRRGESRQATRQEIFCFGVSPALAVLINLDKVRAQLRDAGALRVGLRNPA